MTIIEIIIPFIIYLAIPLAGLLFFRVLKKQMKSENIQNAPTAEIFIIFATYGGLLLVTFTTLFCKWSGLASLGTFYLLIGAPIAMGSIAYRYRQKKTVSKYHNLTYNFGRFYFVIAPVIFLALFLLSKN